MFLVTWVRKSTPADFLVPVIILSYQKVFKTAGECHLVGNNGQLFVSWERSDSGVADKLSVWHSSRRRRASVANNSGGTTDHTHSELSRQPVGNYLSLILAHHHSACPSPMHLQQPRRRCIIYVDMMESIKDRAPKAPAETDAGGPRAQPTQAVRSSAAPISDVRRAYQLAGHRL